MPSVSKAQHNLMEMVAHGGKPREKGPSVSVAKEFVAADKGKSFSKTVSKRHKNDSLGFKADQVSGTPGRQRDY